MSKGNRLIHCLSWKANDKGDVHVAIDGCFSLGRWLTSGKAHNITDLKESLRQRQFTRIIAGLDISKNCRTSNTTAIVFTNSIYNKSHQHAQTFLLNFKPPSRVDKMSLDCLQWHVNTTAQYLPPTCTVAKSSHTQNFWLSSLLQSLASIVDILSFMTLVASSSHSYRYI